MPERVTEFHNIMPLANIVSVLEHGILSHARAVRLEHLDISMQAIQDRRARVQVPGGLRLHKYATLYFHARNPMMYKRQGEVEHLCILRVSKTVLDIPGTVITDQNASSGYVRFLDPTAINQLPLERIYAADWRHPDDQIANFRHKSQKCAEVLVPHVIPPEHIFSAYVVNDIVQTTLTDAGFSLPIEINSYLFFR
jgi:hypothetical protein